MIQVWKCGFCSKTSIDPNQIMEHELECSFNPINKTCYTCKHHYYYYESPCCEIKLDVVDGEDDGNCKGWLTNNKNELRNLKIQKICKNLVKG